ncbi:MAG: DEAD/DEAH box helicase family protein [Elusimicrobia bacterium]|nr:DEAD/DEAH box helicase family protein [Elusimicrobiota bacterium]MBK8125806.1 DEAD/DEAH box helicase family protein [Elusimicrobiota bacterium]
MKLQFDPNQQFQLDAVASVVDLFDGQPNEKPDFSIIHQEEGEGLFSGKTQTELGLGNRLILAEDKLLANTRKVQTRNDLEVDGGKPLESWELVDATKGAPRRCPHFSIEMETGTGKTYVYLRTIFELSQRYGFQKFIIVVPSVAIREGVLKNIEITGEHFKAIYNNLPFEHFVYDARRINKLRQFAVSNALQILIINIDAFRKKFAGTDEEKKSNVIYKESDRLSGRQPIEFIQAARPIVIIDEPQSVDNTEKAQDAIRALNPLCTLRYSATHRNPYNLIYRLDPIRAFELKLVKQIVVANAAPEGASNDAFVRVEKIDNIKGIRAKVRLHRQTANGPVEKSLYVKKGTDLYTVSEERANYGSGFQVVEINAEPGNAYIRFSNGEVLREGEERGGLRDDVWRLQIRHTVKKHLEKELQTRSRGIKVLSLFFIDRVSNYRDYDAEGKPVQGKLALAVEQCLAEFAKDDRFKDLDWLRLSVDKLHNGYFAQDKKGVLKDTRGDTKDDDEIYNLIMKDKERLLSMDEPLRFIFSHSALREGWDNPNVFQICTLNESRSALRKRQEIGRGLRLPVDQTGARVIDESINKLLVVANESYEDFARALQTEYEEDCGVTFGKVPITVFAKMVRIVDGEERPVGPDVAKEIQKVLLEGGFIDAEGRLQPSFDPKRKDFKINLPEHLADLAPAVVDLLAGYQMSRHIRKERDEGPNRFRKDIALSPEFKVLWERIKPKTTYRVEFTTEELVTKTVSAIRNMERIEPARINLTTGMLEVTKAGVGAKALSASMEEVKHTGGIPDILGYLQNETELTRGTIFRILKESSRLTDFFVNPQRFMDKVAMIIKAELHRLCVDGIKYERLAGPGPEAEWEMALFKNEELVNYLTSLPVKKSIYEQVVYESEIERTFAEKLDQREDIRLFVKLPDWFQIDTPVGKYNPDWAIVKHDSDTIYMVKETKGTKEFLKLRTTEADKVRCGEKHFQALGVPFAVAVTADEV